MKKILFSLLLAGVIVAAFGFTGTASAQGPANRRGAEYGTATSADPDRVVNEDVHDLMIEAWSTSLGISVEELQTRLDAGERMSTIALSTGLTLEEFYDLKSDIHASVADAALAAGYIDEAQAERMSQMVGGNGGGLGARRSGSGFGRGMFGNGVQTGSCQNLP
jgi:AraC-like DNA-binding protein